MWIKSQLNDDGIELLWQVRTRRVGGEVHVYDSNGDMESATPCNEFAYGDPMKSAGVIPLNDSFVEFCGAERFEEFANAVMRHSAYMLAGGYGETPEEIVSWFSDFSDTDRPYIGNGEYKFIEDCDPFNDIKGLIGTVYMSEENTLNVLIGVRKQEFSVPLIDDNDVISFMVSTIPI